MAGRERAGSVHRAHLIREMDDEIRMERLLLNGHTNQKQLAAAFGISQQAVGHKIRNIYDRWAEEAEDQSDVLRELRINQLNMLMQKSLNAYELSSKIEVPYEEEYECPECRGHKQMEEMPGEFAPCPVCSGTGVVTEDNIKVVEGPGDVAYLKLGKELIIEMSKLSGVYPQGSGLRTSAKAVMQTTSLIDDAGIRQEVSRLYYESDSEDVITAKAIIDEIDRQRKALAKKKTPNRSIVESTIVREEQDDEEE